MNDKNFGDLTSLLKNNKEAYDYFTGLPQYVREMISDRRDNVKTIDDLRTYADNLLSGDK
jgi:hypothetical protein